MKTTFIFALQAALTLILYQAQNNLALGLESDCPQDCVCYKEYMSNLASWKWIETDVNIQKDDPQHEDFNPYTEHNEVYDNPALVKKRQSSKFLETVTCILRSNSSDQLSKTLNSLSPSIQVLSLIQAPGSGNITLEKTHFQKLHSLIGMELQGHYTAGENKITSDILYIAANAFKTLKKLTYLSMDAVILQQQSIENQIQKPSRTIIRFNYSNVYDDEDFFENDIPSSQVILLQSPTPSKEENNIVPYSVYKTESKQKRYPVQPKIAVAFTGLPSLQQLRISGCNLQDISWDMFYRLNNLKYLLLDNNDLLFLPDFVFYATSNLTALSLSRNRILNLQTVGLVGLLYLQKLDVSHNNITHLSELSLPPFPHLEVADFRHNPIESIFPNTFEVMNSTKTLFLGSHSTQLEFSPSSFYGLILLTRLDIINVRIDFLERPMLKGMPELKSLTMTGTISRISYDAFSEVPNLEKLILKQCAIRKISMDAFFGLTSLIELDLSHNNLTFLPPGVFDQQLSLREVFLQHNKLKTLPPSIFSKIPAKLIRLEGNPWSCSCDMKYWDPSLTNKVKRYHVPPPNSTICNRKYDKGACIDNQQQQEPTFQVRYVYEKRVSPICQTPRKFTKRSVFEVLRKELQYCANSLQQNISFILKASNPTETLDIIGTVRVPINPAKELEKQLLFPAKVRKPGKAIQSPDLNNVVQTISNDSMQEPSGTIEIIPRPLSANNNNNIPIASDEQTSNSADTPNATNLTISHVQVTESFGSSTFSQIPTTEMPNILVYISKPKPRKSKNSRQTNYEALPSINTAAENLSTNTNIFPPVSKKALKLIKYQQKLQRKQQG